MGNIKSKGSGGSGLGHERLEESSEHYFAKIEKRNIVYTRDTTIGFPATQGGGVGGGGNRKGNVGGSSQQSLYSDDDLDEDDVAVSVSRRGNRFRGTRRVGRKSKTGKTTTTTTPRSHHPLSMVPLSQVNPTNTHHKNGNGIPHGVSPTGSSSFSPSAAITPTGSNGAMVRPLPPGKSDVPSRRRHRSQSRPSSMPTTGNGHGAFGEGGSGSGTQNTDTPLTTATGASNDFEAATLSDGTLSAEIVRPGKVTCVSFHPRRPWLLAIGTDDGRVCVCHGDGEASTSTSTSSSTSSSSSSHRIDHVPPREGKVRSLDWSPQGDMLAVGGNDCAAVVLAYPGWETRGEWEREDRVYAVRFSPQSLRRDDHNDNGDNNETGTSTSTERGPLWLAIGGFDGMVAVVDVHTGQKVAEVPRLGLVLCLGWSTHNDYSHKNNDDDVDNDDKNNSDNDNDNDNESSLYLAVGGSDSRAAIISTEDWEVVGEVQRTGSVQCVEWGGNGRFLAVGGHDGTVAVVDVTRRCIHKEIVSTTADSRVSSMAWSPDSRYLAVGGSDRRCVLFETSGYTMVHSVHRREGVTCVDWRPDGARLAIGSDDKTVATLRTGWGVSSQRSRSNNGSRSRSSSFQRRQQQGQQQSPQSHRLSLIEDSSGEGDSVSGNGSVDHDDEQSTSTHVSASRPTPPGTQGWTMDDVLLADGVGVGPSSSGAGSQDDSDAVHAVAFWSSSDGRTHHLCVAGAAGAHGKESGRLSVYLSSGNSFSSGKADDDAWTLVRTVTLSRPPRSLSYAPDGRRLAVGFHGASSRILEVPTYRPLTTVGQQHHSGVHCLAYLRKGGHGHGREPNQNQPNQTLLATGDEDGFLNLMETENWTTVASMDGSESPVYALDVWDDHDNDRSVLAVGRKDGSCTVHSVDDAVRDNFWLPLAELERGSAVHAVSYGTDCLAVGGGDWTVGVYSIHRSYALIHELKMDGWIFALDWSRSGRHLVMGGTMGCFVVVSPSPSTSPSSSKPPTRTFVVKAHLSIDETAAVSFRDDDKRLAVAGRNGKVRVVDVDRLNEADDDDDDEANHEWKHGTILDRRDEPDEDLDRMPSPIKPRNRKGNDHGHDNDDDDNDDDDDDDSSDSDSDDEDDSSREDDPVEDEREPTTNHSHHHHRRLNLNEEDGHDDTHSPRRPAKTQTGRSSASMTSRGSTNTNQRSLHSKSSKGSQSSNHNNKNNLNNKNHNDNNHNNKTRANPKAKANHSKMAKTYGYASRPEPLEFLSTGDAFLAPYDFDRPPLVLRNFVALVRSLTAHVQYLQKQEPAVRESLATQDDGKPLQVLCRILKEVTVNMTAVLEDEDGVDEWWEPSSHKLQRRRPNRHHNDNDNDNKHNHNHNHSNNDNDDHDDDHTDAGSIVGVGAVSESDAALLQQWNGWWKEVDPTGCVALDTRLLWNHQQRPTPTPTLTSSPAPPPPPPPHSAGAGAGAGAPHPMYRSISSETDDTRSSHRHRPRDLSFSFDNDDPPPPNQHHQHQHPNQNHNYIHNHNPHHVSSLGLNKLLRRGFDDDYNDGDTDHSSSSSSSRWSSSEEGDAERI